MVNEVVIMAKPKTGEKTDGDIMRAVADAEWHDTVGAVKIAIKLARQEGIEQGRVDLLAEQKFAKPKTVIQFIKTHRMRLTALLNQYAEKKITHQKMFSVLRRWTQ